MKADRTKYKNVQPLLIVHGWPGSVYEFKEIIHHLVDPQSKDGNPSWPKDLAFDLIAPSIPGYGWSDKPSKPGKICES